MKHLNLQTLLGLLYVACLGLLPACSGEDQVSNRRTTSDEASVSTDPSSGDANNGAGNKTNDGTNSKGTNNVGGDSKKADVPEVFALAKALGVDQCSFKSHPLVDKALFIGTALTTSIPTICCNQESILLVKQSCYRHLVGRISWLD